MNAKRDEESALVTLYQQLPQNDPNLIRIFQRGDLEWAVLGAEAERVAQMVYHTTSALRRVGNAQLQLCAMNPTLFRSFLGDALQKWGLRLEIYENEANSKTRWQSPRRASPGNLSAIEDLLGRSSDQRPVVIAVSFSGATEKTVGVCFVDAEARELGLCQFVDNDLFSNLESLVIQLGAKEALLPDSENSDARKLAAVMSKLDVLVTCRKPSQFSSADVEQDLQRLTGKTALELSRELKLERALAAAGAAVRYLGIMATAADGGYTILEHNLDQFMRLDAAALKALNVMPTARDGSKSMSLYGLLNHCRTVSGQRMLAQWLKQPLMDVTAISERHNLVEAFLKDPISRTKLQDDCFGSVPDLARISRRFHTGKARLEDVVRVYQLVVKIPELLEAIQGMSDIDEVNQLYITPLRDGQKQLAKLVELVETTIDLDALERHEYVVKADFDENLGELRHKMDAEWSAIESEHRDAQSNLHEKVRLENNTSYGWAFRLTRVEASVLRQRREYIELGTQKAGMYFTTASLRKRVSAFTELAESYRRAQSGVAREVVNIASTYLPVLQPLANTLAHLDVIVSFSHVSAFSALPYVRPDMNASALVLKEARHPCMEVQADMMFIPNDVDLSAHFAIVTGPNMGGKSTYIRQVGVISLMAQVGCFVPCTEAKLPVVDCVLARVGAGDSQLKGISTFMAEMLETASILKTATPRSLIIVDELGRGTSTYDGFGLAWAISQHIVEHVGCFCLFATHFHELTALADRYPGKVQNLHVIADDHDNNGDKNDITLLYQVKPGISDKSFGIHVAEVVQFPDKVVRMAKRKAEELEAADFAARSDGELRAILRDWAKQSQELAPSAAVANLREVMRAAEPKLNANPYLRQLLAEL